MTEQTLSSSHDLQYVSHLAEDFYFDHLKDQLEKTDWGKYVVIEGESQKYFVHEDLLEALNEAEEECPEKYFTIIKIGSVQPLSITARENESEGTP